MASSHVEIYQDDDVQEAQGAYACYQNEQEKPPGMPGQYQEDVTEEGENQVHQDENQVDQDENRMPFRELTEAELEQKRQAQLDELREKIFYSERYYDNTFEYRHVILPKQLLPYCPTSFFQEPPYDRLLRLLKEQEWRLIGIQQSEGWQHYEIHAPEPHILLFRREKDYQMKYPQGKAYYLAQVAQAREEAEALTASQQQDSYLYRDEDRHSVSLVTDPVVMPPDGYIAPGHHQGIHSSSSSSVTHEMLKQENRSLGRLGRSHSTSNLSSDLKHAAMRPGSDSAPAGCEGGQVTTTTVQAIAAVPQLSTIAEDDDPDLRAPLPQLEHYQQRDTNPCFNSGHCAGNVGDRSRLAQPAFRTRHQRTSQTRRNDGNSNGDDEQYKDAARSRETDMESVIPSKKRRHADGGR